MTTPAGTSQRRPGQTHAQVPVLSFSDMVGHLEIPLCPGETMALQHALSSTGELDLQGLSPATAWALDGLWQALSEPGAPEVHSIVFPAGMAAVPDGVPGLPYLESIRLPQFSGNFVQGGKGTRLNIAISVPPGVRSLHFALSQSDKVDFLDRSRPRLWSISRHDDHGKQTARQQEFFQAREADVSKIETVIRGLQQNILQHLKTSRSSNVFQNQQLPPEKRLAFICEVLCTPVNDESRLPLFHHVQQDLSNKNRRESLRRLVATVLADDDLTASEKEYLLIMATLRGAQTAATDRLLPDLVADILERLSKDARAGVSSFSLRHAEICLLPRADGMDTSLHHWLQHDEEKFSAYVTKALSQETAHLTALFHQDHAGRSVLHIAAAEGWPDAANALIGKILAATGAQRGEWLPQLRNAMAMKTHDGDTLLWHAAARGEQICARLQPLLQQLLQDPKSPGFPTKLALCAALLHIERPRAAAGGIVRSTMFTALEGSRLYGEERKVLEALIDCLTCCAGDTAPTLLHRAIEAKGDSSIINYLGALSMSAGLRVDDTVVKRYLCARNPSNDTALHLCTSHNRSCDVDQFVEGVLSIPAQGDLSSLWNARDGRGVTPFWAAIDAKALTSAAAFLNQAAGLTEATDVRRARFAQCIEAGFRTADIARLRSMLSARDGDGRGLLHILARHDPHQAMTFVADQLLARNFNETTMEHLWTQALRSDPGGPSLLVEALQHGKVLNGLLSSLMETKRLSEDGKQRLLAVLLTMTDDTVDRKKAALPVQNAVNEAKRCSNDWKTAQRVLIDLLTRPDNSTQLHVVATMKSAEIARPRLKACVQLLRKGIVSPNSLAAYLDARNKDGRTAFEEAACLRNLDVLAAFLEVAAADDPGVGPPILQTFVFDSFDAADPEALLAADDTGRTVVHAVVDAGGGRALDLLMACLTGSPADTGVVVDSLAGALASCSQGSKTLLWRLAPSGLDALSPMITALAETTVWISSQKEQLWAALVGKIPPSLKATKAVLQWLSSTAGDQVPESILQALARAAQPARAQVSRASLPEPAPTPKHYLETRHVDLGHVLHGHINSFGKAVGGHALMTDNRNRLRERPGAVVTIHPNGTSTVDVDIWCPASKQWIEKPEPSTFFPPAWPRGEIYRQIASALRRDDAFASGTGPWDGVSESGIVTRFRRDPGSGRVICFPLSN